MQKLQATPTKLHTRTTYVSKKLDTCTHVLVRQDHVQKPLDMLYKGPYRTRKYMHFILDLDGRQDSVSLDRVKPAFIDHSRDDRDDSGVEDADPKLVHSESPELVIGEAAENFPLYLTQQDPAELYIHRNVMQHNVARH